MTAEITEFGITVMPEYVQSDGVDAVIEKVVDVAKATAIATSPYVVARSAEGVGHREPPIDGGAGKKRLLDRALWGEREVWMTTASSFAPDASLYTDMPYRPPEANALTEESGADVGAFIIAAKARGIETWMQIQAAIPPCHRVQFGGPVAGDAPMLPDGSLVEGRVDNNTSLAADAVRRYVRAFVIDLTRTYPQVDGFKFDWPEYPAYHLDTLFFDFNPQAARFAAPLGLDFEALRKGVAAFLADLSSGATRGRGVAFDSLDAFRESLFAAWPVLDDLLAFRTAIVTDYARFLRETVEEASGGRMKMFLQTFPPPLNTLTGFDLSAVAEHCDEIGVKFYTMHWPLIERNYLNALASRTDFAPADIARALGTLLEIGPRGARSAESIRYPEPDEAHPCDDADIVAKMQAASAEIPADVRRCGITHAYGPLDDVMRRFAAVADGANGAIHINRFGYMSDAKLEACGALVERSRA